MGIKMNPNDDYAVRYLKMSLRFYRSFRDSGGLNNLHQSIFYLGSASVFCENNCIHNSSFDRVTNLIGKITRRN